MTAAPAVGHVTATRTCHMVGHRAVMVRWREWGEHGAHVWSRPWWLRKALSGTVAEEGVLCVAVRAGLWVALCVRDGVVCGEC